jgi:glycosyltransferase involved in cell wall biosynthesis
MQLSIVIPTHNYGQYLDRSLQSVLSQAATDTEVVVVDDGSTDNTAEIMRGYVARYPQVRYFRQAQSGPGQARNTGASHAQGDWLMFLDADDYLDQKALAVLTQAIRHNPAAGAVIGGYVNQDRRGRQTLMEGPTVRATRLENFAAFLAGDLRIYHGSFVIRREAFYAINEYPINIFLSEDKVLLGRLFANYPVASVPEPIVYICAHPGSLRDYHERRHREALSYVEQLFDPRYLPSEFQQFRDRAYAKAQLELEQSLYRQRQYSQAIGYFHQALRLSWRQALRPKYVRYYLVSLLGLAFRAVSGRKPATGALPGPAGKQPAPARQRRRLH